MHATTPSTYSASELVNKFHLYTTTELLTLPPPEWLIDGVVGREAFAVAFGPSGVGKSFVALDMAMSVAIGQPWQGRAVRQGPAVYVVGEGTGGVANRVRAWLKHRKLSDVPDAFFLLGAPQLMGGSDVDDLAATIAKEGLKPALIVIDTLARSFVGGDENSAKDVGQFVDSCVKLRAATGATVLVIHHTGKSSDSQRDPHERGSSALRAAADTMMPITRGKGTVLHVRNDKQKDGEEFDAIAVEMTQVELDLKTTSGEPATSLVLVPATETVPASDTALLPGEKAALEVLSEMEKASSGEWRLSLSGKLKKEVATKTFDNWRSKLVARALVRTLPSAPHQYEATEEGLALVGHSLPEHAA